MMTRYIIGCMTGTSLDGLDAALVRIEGESLAMNATLVDVISVDFHRIARLPDKDGNEFSAFRWRIGKAMGNNQQRPIDLMRLAREMAFVHADAVEQLIKRQGPNHPPVDFVVAHGQTIWHAPNNPVTGLSWQLFDPWPIVHRMKLPVCYDLRQADLIAGGQGAPITPIADLVMFGHAARSRLVVNLGGIINVTHLPAGGACEQITGGDVGPCNILLDGLTQMLIGKPYDFNGEAAQQGAIDFELLKAIRNMTQTAGAATGSRPRSLGREQFDSAWLERIHAYIQSNDIPPDNALASAAQFVAHTIREVAERHQPDDIILAGGGAKNLHLASTIARSYVDATTRVSDDLDIPVEAREAMAFAILGALSQDGVPITLPQITGSTNPGRAGVWAYP